MSKRTVFITYTAFFLGERIFSHTTKKLSEGEKLSEKWIENQEAQINIGVPGAIIVSWEILEDEEKENLKTFFFLRENNDGSSTISVPIYAYTKDAALNQLRAIDCYKNMMEDSTRKWWLTEVLEYNRGYLA